MLEIIVLFVILSLFTACFFSPVGGSMRYVSRSQLVAGDASAVGVNVVDDLKEPNEPVETGSFLNYLKNEIEAELAPRPTCSVLQRHYDSLVAVEVENRLALMAE